MKWDDQSIKRTCNDLLSSKIHRTALKVSLFEFRIFYKTFWDVEDNPPIVSLVNLQTVIKGQFSSVSPQHFDIVSDKPLLEEDFEFIHEKYWYGAATHPKKFGVFLWEEAKLNGWKLSLALGLTSTLTIA